MRTQGNDWQGDNRCQGYPCEDRMLAKAGAGARAAGGSGRRHRRGEGGGAGPRKRRGGRDAGRHPGSGLQPFTGWKGSTWREETSWNFVDFSTITLSMSG